jgi:hypothetical protein
MPLSGRYLLSASMDVEPAVERLFHEVYDAEHVPLLLKVPGVVSVTRFRRQPLTMIIGGERRTVTLDSEPMFSALYELESPDVLVTPAWAAAVDAGRWPGQVRPHTKNRKHLLLERMG